MASTRQCGPTQHDPYLDLGPPETPGICGLTDAADPNWKACVGDTPGPAGTGGDRADVNVCNTQQSHAEYGWKLLCEPEESRAENLPEIAKPKPPPKAPSFVTDDFKRQLTATILAESPESQLDKVRWVYYATTNKAGGVQGLEKSSAFKYKQHWYKVWLFLLGDQTYAGSALPQTGEQGKFFIGFSTVKDFCVNNGYMKTVAANRAARARQLVEEMYAGATNPYPGWTGQGNVTDFNRDDDYWRSARYYYWLQVGGEVKEKYVGVLSEGASTQFIFDADGIKEYLNRTKQKVPAEVKKY